MKQGMVLLLTIAAGCAAPSSDVDAGSASRRGVLIMAHGGDEAWDDRVKAVVEPLRDSYPTEIAFGMARSSTMEAAVQRLEGQGVEEIAVVRMFISGDSFLDRTESILGLREASHDHAEHSVSHAIPAASGGGHHMGPAVTISSNSSFALSRAGVSDSSLVDEIIMDRVRGLSADPESESVLILAHGPGDEAENERWLANMRLRAQKIHGLGAFKHIECETLREDWPERRAEAEKRIREYVELGNLNGGRVIVIPFRIAGFGPYRKVLEGLNYVADEQGLCPHPKMTQWLRETAESCFGLNDS